MTYSYSQISQYLPRPRRYRHRYLDGWKKKDTRAPMLFGRAFETALGALFRHEDALAVQFDEWSACQSQDLHYSNRDYRKQREAMFQTQIATLRWSGSQAFMRARFNAQTPRHRFASVTLTRSVSFPLNLPKESWCADATPHRFSMWSWWPRPCSCWSRWFLKRFLCHPSTPARNTSRSAAWTGR